MENINVPKLSQRLKRMASCNARIISEQRAKIAALESVIDEHNRNLRWWSRNGDANQKLKALQDQNVTMQSKIDVLEANNAIGSRYHPMYAETHNALIKTEDAVKKKDYIIKNLYARLEAAQEHEGLKDTREVINDQNAIIENLQAHGLSLVETLREEMQEKDRVCQAVWATQQEETRKKDQLIDILQGSVEEKNRLIDALQGLLKAAGLVDVEAVTTVEALQELLKADKLADAEPPYTKSPSIVEEEGAPLEKSDSNMSKISSNNINEDENYDGAFMLQFTAINAD